eukprot:2638490-Prymnesium_polylepis.1
MELSFASGVAVVLTPGTPLTLGRRHVQLCGVRVLATAHLSRSVSRWTKRVLDETADEMSVSLGPPAEV